jgi:hypothetical protein
MNTNTFTYGPENLHAAELFDLFRLSTAKQTVDVSPNTLRAYHKLGLPFYRRGKVVFVSRRELNDFIRECEAANPSAENSADSTEEATETQMDADGPEPAADPPPTLPVPWLTPLGEKMLREYLQSSPDTSAGHLRPLTTQ